MKKIGLVGGLGWVSTLEYYKLINIFTNQNLGGHKSAHVLIESLDEGLFLDNQSKDPTEKLCEQMIVDAVGVLVSGGAEVVALCANGLHRFMPSIKSKYAPAVTMKPGGTGIPALVISPRLAPLPPTIPTSSLVTSLNQTTAFLPLFIDTSIYLGITPCLMAVYYNIPN